ncbi:MAG: TOBE domain-containing protein [Ferrovum myxofaciens]
MEDLATDREGFNHLQNIYKRFSMRTSARNQFSGKIKKISRGSVNAEIKISLDDHNEIVSVITAESVELMELEIGVEVYALIKAPSILLTTEASTQFSAENRLCGVISRIQAGEVNAAISLVLPNEKTVTSIVTLETIGKLELVVGTLAQAVFTSSTVILARI